MKAIILIVIGALLGLHGTGAEKRIAEELRKELNAQSVTVKCDATREGFLLKGELKNIRISVNGYCSPQLCVDRYDVDMHGVRVGRSVVPGEKKIVLKEVKSVDWSVWINQDELQKYLRSRSPLLRGCEVFIEKDALRVRVPAVMSFFGKPRFVEFKGRLVGEKGGIGLRVTRVNTFGMSFSAWLLDYIIGRMNPIITEDMLNQQVAENSPYKDDAVKYDMRVKNIVEKYKVLNMSGDASLVIAQ